MRVDLALHRARDILVVACLILLMLGLAKATSFYPFENCSATQEPEPTHFWDARL